MRQHVGWRFRSVLQHEAVNPSLISTVFARSSIKWLPPCQRLCTSLDGTREFGRKSRKIERSSFSHAKSNAPSQVQRSVLHGLRSRVQQTDPWTSRGPNSRAYSLRYYSHGCVAWRQTSRDKKITLPHRNNYRVIPKISLAPSLCAYKSSNKPSTSSTSKSTTAQDDDNITKAQSPPHTSSKPILDRLPHLHHLHRPSKEELLAAATGFWSRLKVRFKWATIRSARPFNMDEIYAVFSWILFGHFIWIIVGTTTFFSLAILFVNTVFAQETLARWIGNYITKSSGLKVVFESAIVPKWSNGVISFKRVFVSRRPGQGSSNVSKGSQSTAVAAAAASAARTDDVLDDLSEDTNYTQFDLSIDSVDVTLSFAKWFNGKGLLRDVEVTGVRGIIDRTSLQRSSTDIDPRSYRHHHHTGDFELDSFKLEDLLVTVHQPGNFRPFHVSVYSCELPRLRQQWLFYDFLCANNVSGSFDDSLFAIHPRQIHGITGARLHDGVEPGHEMEWKKHSRIQIDGLSIDHLNRGVDGPFSWIYEGNVDIAADVMIPPETEDSIAKVMSDVYDRVEATVTSSHDRIDKKNYRRDQAEDLGTEKDIVKDRYVVCDVRLQLNDVRAAVPLFTYDITYVNNAMIRPIVAYINSRRTFIPINCRVVERVSDFDGSWTIYDSGLLTDLSREMYDAFARDVADNEARSRRLRKVGIWTIQLAAQALFMGLAGSIA